MFTEEERNIVAAVARAHGVAPAGLLAVAEIESGGRAFALVAGRREPLIRFEGHYFDLRLSGAAQARARAEGLASPKAGAIGNPATQEARWALLTRAAAIDRRAAWESTSWGVGQVMGAHWALLGFADAEAFAAEARSGLAGQARLAARYIVETRLAKALAAQDWEGFARGYNGPGFRANGYDRKLAAAFARHAAGGETPSAPDPASGLMRRGASGEAVRDLQHVLNALGYPLETDGRFGPATQAAVRRFQAAQGLTADGIVGPLTRAALAGALPFGAAPAGIWGRLAGWLARLLA